MISLRTSILTSQSLTRVCATIAVVGTARPPRATTRAAAFALPTAGGKS
jgi:hypothetical protein